MTPLTLHIEGMSCGHCLNAVTKALSGLPGIADLAVRIGRADLNYDPTAIDSARIVAAIGAAGYRATPGSTP